MLNLLLFQSIYIQRKTEELAREQELKKKSMGKKRAETEDM